MVVIEWLLAVNWQITMPGLQPAALGVDSQVAARPHQHASINPKLPTKFQLDPYSFGVC